MAEKENAKYPCSQKDFNSVCETAWGNFFKYLVDFQAHKAKYKESTALDALAALAAGMRLPDARQRSDAAESARREMMPLAQGCTDKYVLLKTYIEDAFTENVWDIKFNSAGQGYFEDCIKLEWDSLAMLCNSMITFMETNKTVLEANDNMPANFKASVEAAAEGFQEKYKDYKKASETGVATQEKISALNKCYKTMTGMLRDGKAIFRNNAAKRELFVFGILLDAINPKKAGMLGLVTDEETDEALPNAVISVKYANEPAIVKIADEDGYYSEELRGGMAVVTVTADDHEPRTETVMIPTGGTVRLNVKLKKAA